MKGFDFEFSDYKFVDLADEDLQRVHAMERDLGRKYDREIVLIAYERPKQLQASIDAEGDEGPGGPTLGSPILGSPIFGGPNLGDPRRGATFGYTEPQFDGYPTLADMQTKVDGNPDGLHRSVDE